MFFHIGFVFAKPFLNSCQICHFRLRCHSLNLKTATYLQAGDERVRCSSQIGHWTKSNSQKIFDWNKIERSIFELNCNRLLQQAIFPDLGSKMLLKFAFFFSKFVVFRFLPISPFCPICVFVKIANWQYASFVVSFDFFCQNFDESMLNSIVVNP